MIRDDWDAHRLLWKTSDDLGCLGMTGITRDDQRSLEITAMTRDI